MKFNRISISFNIIIYLLFILIPFHLNESLKIKYKQKLEIDLMKEKRNITKESEGNYMDQDKDKDEDDHYDHNPRDDDFDVETYEKMQNLYKDIYNLSQRKESLGKEITKNKIYIIFYGLIDGILFLIIVIYSSIKCFILCNKRNDNDIPLSLIANNIGEFYIDDNEEEEIYKSNKKSKNQDTPTSGSNKGKNKKYKTSYLNNYKASNEDKQLYKPYKNEDI